jgi:hypothetical protein
MRWATAAAVCLTLAGILAMMAVERGIVPAREPPAAGDDAA